MSTARRPVLAPAARALVATAPALFTAGWVWSGHRTPDKPHATRSISALSAAGQPCRGPVLVGQVVQGLAHLVNAELARRAGLRAVATALAVSGLATLVTTGAPLPADEAETADGTRTGHRSTHSTWWDRAHVWSAGTGMVAFHLAPLLGTLDPRLPRRTPRAAVAALAVALPATGYFTHRLARRAGTGRVYGWAERLFLTTLLAWAASLPAAYPPAAAVQRPAGASTGQGRPRR